MSSDKAEDEIKIEDLFSLLDKCITSDKDNVKKALRELLVVVALSTPSDVKNGPLTKMLEKMGKMEKRIIALEKELSNRSGSLTYEQLEMMKKMVGSNDIYRSYGTSSDPWKKYTSGYDPNF